jgi:hypothetical protein
MMLRKIEFSDQKNVNNILAWKLFRAIKNNRLNDTRCTCYCDGCAYISNEYCNLYHALFLELGFHAVYYFSSEENKMTLEFIEVNNTIKSKETIETMYELTMEFYTTNVKE